MFDKILDVVTISNEYPYTGIYKYIKPVTVTCSEAILWSRKLIYIGSLLGLLWSQTYLYLNTEHTHSDLKMWRYQHKGVTRQIDVVKHFFNKLNKWKMNKYSSSH